MSDCEALHDEPFRIEARRWLEVNFPSGLAYKNPQAFLGNPALAAGHHDFQLWRSRIVERSWGTPSWPAVYGGAGLGIGEERIIAEEMARIGAFNPVRGYGLMMLGPTLLEFGTDAQKMRHLPPISRGDVRWCQGFSEPGAGSDLAALQTKCVDMGDHWRVTGQKIWTSDANHADWCFALVRTDTGRKQGGISFLLIDMRSPGIEARPITLISGSTHFCEVFFDDVKVPKENLVGEVNQGWTIAKRLLQHERDGLSIGRGEGADLAELARLHVGVDADGRIDDPDLRTRLIRHAMRARAFTMTTHRLAVEIRSGEKPAALVSVLKNLGSEVAQERAELIVEILGARGLGWTGEAYREDELEAVRAWLHSRAFSIYGGSYEIQSNIVAKRVLGLPEQ